MYYKVLFKLSDRFIGNAHFKKDLKLLTNFAYSGERGPLSPPTETKLKAVLMAGIK
jgi:hypothetical protein